MDSFGGRRRLIHRRTYPGWRTPQRVYVVGDRVLVEGVLAEGKQAGELAAWTLLVSAVYNLDVTRTRQ